MRENNLKNGDKIIIDFKGSILVAQYFKEFDDIILKSLNGKKINLKENDFNKNLKVIAVIKGKYFFDI